jgi:outer membrane receptor protein involved in Fe transport
LSNNVSRVFSFFVCAGLALAQPAPGTITGTIYDGQTGRPIVGVQVAVDGQMDPRYVTDSDGRYTIAVAPGPHSLRFTAEGYLPVEIREVVVESGRPVEASTLMSSERVVTSIDVVEKLDAAQSTAEAMLLERKLSVVVSDSVSRQELSEGAAGTAAGALEKVTGVSVVGDGFVYVRGLGERYSATQLNGAIIPTTEPEKRVVPLDLFPTGMIESIKVAKTYSADLPAEFSGGLVQMQTMEFPSRHTFNVGIKGGFNTVTTFDRFLTYPGSAADFWGFGSGARALPAAIGNNRRLIQGVFPADQLQVFGRSFANIWEPTEVARQRPAADWSASGGTSFGKFGLVGGLTFSNRPQLRREFQRYLRMAGAQPIIFGEYPDFREYTEDARLGGVINLSYRVNPNNKLIYRNTWTHDTEKSAREFQGLDGGTGSVINAQRLRYVERQVLSQSAEGEHVLPSLRNSVFRWQFNFSNSRRNEPDLREVIRNVEDDGRLAFAALGSSGLRFFTDLKDRIYDPQADYSIPFYKGSVAALVKIGFRGTFRRRDFNARRFRFIPQQLSTLNLYLPSNALFAPENIRPSGFQIAEFTRNSDVYEASMDVYAGYAMVDLTLGAKWRVSGGLRIEDGRQDVLTIDNQIPGAVPVLARLQNRDPVPALNVIYSLDSKQNIRVSISRTLSRPDFRELSPFDFNNVLGGFITVGNPNLRRASIMNYDVRWEMFPGGNQLVAASAFVKTFKDPVEQTILASNDLRQSFINAKGAKNYGFELEYRHNLGDFHSRLREFAITSNLTFVDSNIEIREQDLGFLTSRNRPLLGQSRWIYNGTLQWARPQWFSTASLAANYVGSRITDVGTFGLPDIQQGPNTMLDFVYQYNVSERSKWSYRFEAENLLNNNFHWTQGSFLQRQYRLGRTFQIGVSYSFF